MDWECHTEFYPDLKRLPMKIIDHHFRPILTDLSSPAVPASFLRVEWLSEVGDGHDLLPHTLTCSLTNSLIILHKLFVRLFLLCALKCSVSI